MYECIYVLKINKIYIRSFNMIDIIKFYAIVCQIQNEYVFCYSFVLFLLDMILSTQPHFLNINVASITNSTFNPASYGPLVRAEKTPSSEYPLPY